MPFFVTWAGRHVRQTSPALASRHVAALGLLALVGAALRIHDLESQTMFTQLGRAQ